MPFIFPKEEFNGKSYFDGAAFPKVGDNTPIRPVYDTGVENIIVVHLNRETIIDKSEFPDSNIIEIVPSVDLGNLFTGTLDFSSYGAKKRIDLGYEDAKKVLQPMLEMLIMSFKNQISLEQLKAHLNQFEKEQLDLIAKEYEIKERMSYDGFDEVIRNLNTEE